MALCPDCWNRNWFYRAANAAKRARVWTGAMVVVALSLGGGSSRCEAARLSQILSARDLAQPILLDQNGNALAFPSSHAPNPAEQAGSIPTYMAFPLLGGEHLPSGLATIVANPSSAGGVAGPLDFSQTMKAQLDQALGQSRAVEVETPAANYLIAILPRRAAAVLATSTPTPTPTNGSTTPTGSTTNPLSSGLLPGPLANWLSAGSSKVLSWTNQGLSELETLLELKRNTTLAHARAKSNKPSLNLEAQVLAPLPVPAPEPSAWMLFGIIFGAIATTGRRWNRNRAESGD